MSAQFTNVKWVMLFACIAFAIYLVKYTVQDLRDEVRHMESALNKEREALALLEAEWSYLNRPARLRRLAKKHLDLDLPKAYQVVDVTVIEQLSSRQNIYASSEGY